MNINKLFKYIFILITSILYIVILFFEIKEEKKDLLKFIVIALCFIYSFIQNGDLKDKWLVRTALLFTVISDYLLVIEGNNFFLSLITFSIVQLVYALRIINFDEKDVKTHLILRPIIFICTILIIKFTIGIKLDSLLIIAIFYFSNLFLNVIYAFINIKKNILFPIGLLLFMGCDMMVGLFNLNIYIDSSNYYPLSLLIDNSLFLIWLFYIPSQVILSLSISTNKNHT